MTDVTRAEPERTAARTAPPERVPSTGEGPASLGAGTPLGTDVRRRMEAVVGSGLEGVRIHADPVGASLAARERSLAVTEGAHVAFAPGMYRPGTTLGDALLAHELAHTRQQSGGAGAPLSSSHGLEREADRVGLHAAFRSLGMTGVGPAPPVSTGRGLQLQRCSADTYFTDEIEALPDREHYERSGELMPQGWEDVVGLPAPDLHFGVGAGQLQLITRPQPDVSGILEEIGHGLRPIPTSLGGDAATLDQEALMARLAVMEARDREITQMVDDAAGVPRRDAPLVFGGAIGNLSWARSVAAPGEERFRLVIGEPSAADSVPEDVAELSRELVRSEQVQVAVLRGLADLRASEAEEELAGARLEGYDAGLAVAEIRDVRAAYASAAWAVLTPGAVTKANRAIARHTEVRRTLLKMKLTHFQLRSSEHPEIKGAVDEMQNWAWQLDEQLTRLDVDAEELRKAEAASDPNFPIMQARFATDAELILVSIEALGEWDRAIQVYDALADNSALVGFGAVDDLVDRLSQMHDAAFDGDGAYLRLLLRDHLADPAVEAFYASVPQIIQWSQFVIALGITFLALIIAAPIGVAVGGLVGAGLVAAGAAEGGVVVLTGTFLAHTAAEALVFTLVSRQLSAGVPGMAPVGPAWQEFLWNWGLFATLRLYSSGLASAMATSSRAAVTTAQFSVTAGILQGYGMLRFAVDEGRPMTSEEIGTMSVQNLIMLAVLSVAARPFAPALGRLQNKANLLRLKASAGRRVAEVEADRAALEKRATERLEDNPQAGPEDLADLRADGRDLDARLSGIVEDVLASSSIDLGQLRVETQAVLADVAQRPLQQYLREAGLDPAIDLRPAGTESVWSFPHGRSEAMMEFFRSQEIAATPETVDVSRTIIQASVPGRGAIQFVERAATPAPAPAPSPPPRAPRRTVVRPKSRPKAAPEKPAEPPRPPAALTPEQEALLGRIAKLRDRVYSWRARERTTPGVREATRAWLEQLTEQANRTRKGGAEHDVEPVLTEIAESLTANIKSFRPQTTDTVTDLQQRLHRHAARAGESAAELATRATAAKDAATRSRLTEASERQLAQQAELLKLAEEAGSVLTRMGADPSFDPRLSVQSIRQALKRVGSEYYDVYLPLDDPVTFKRVSEWMVRETAALESHPGGDILRTMMLDQLHTASEMVMRQSPRQAGIDVAGTARMRQMVLEGIREGRYPAEYVDAFLAAADSSGWPHTRDGRAWQVDHVLELWQGGLDNVRNYLAIDPDLHAAKTSILGRFRQLFREAHRVENEQVEVPGEL